MLMTNMRSSSAVVAHARPQNKGFYFAVDQTSEALMMLLLKRSAAAALVAGGSLQVYRILEPSSRRKGSRLNKQV